MFAGSFSSLTRAGRALTQATSRMSRAAAPVAHEAGLGGEKITHLSDADRKNCETLQRTLCFSRDSPTAVINATKTIQSPPQFESALPSLLKAARENPRVLSVIAQHRALLRS